MYKSKQYARIEEKLDYIIGLLEAQEVASPPEPAEPPPPPAPEPFPGYDKLNVAETLEALKDAKEDKALITYALEYEHANKKRAGVIEQLVNWLG